MAVDFLTNPKIQSSTTNQKIKFLRKKGLTEDEIHLACEKVQIFSQPTAMTSQIEHSVLNMGGLTYKAVSRIDKLKDFLLNSAFLGSICYAIYLFYKVIKLQ